MGFGSKISGIAKKLTLGIKKTTRNTRPKKIYRGAKKVVRFGGKAASKTAKYAGKEYRKSFYRGSSQARSKAKKRKAANRKKVAAVGGVGRRRK